MIKYTRLYDGKVYDSYEECEKDATNIFIEPVDKYATQHVDMNKFTDAIVDSVVSEVKRKDSVKKHKKIKRLFNIGD